MSVPLAMRTDSADGYADGYDADADAEGYADGCDAGGQGRRGIGSARWKAREACVAAAVGLAWSVLSACALLATVYVTSVRPFVCLLSKATAESSLTPVERRNATHACSVGSRSSA
jgi:hypothetical protein